MYIDHLTFKAVVRTNSKTVYYTCLSFPLVIAQQ